MNAWQQSCERFLKLQLRERKLVLYTGLGLIGWLGGLYLVEPMWQHLQKMQQQNGQTQQQIQAMQQQVELVQQTLNQDINAQIKQQLNELERSETELQQKIQQMTGRYISAEQMLFLLKDVLAGSPQVQLVSLQSKEPSAITLAGVEQSAPLLFRHSTELVFEGSYAALQQLLQTLEQLPWQLHWSRLQYQVQQYPVAKLLLELETVSERADYVRI